MRKRSLLAGAVVAVVAGGVVSVAMTAQAETRTRPSLATFLQQQMDQLAFQEVLDLDPATAPAARVVRRAVDKEAVTPEARIRAYAQDDPRPIAQQPQIDATVLELDRRGAIVGSATVLMSPQHPDGVVVPVDGNLHTTDVRWREWDDDGWYANQARGTIDVVPGRENASVDFMAPYPASTMKLMVAYGVLRLADQGVIKLDDTYSYAPATVSSLCGAATTGKIVDYLDRMLTESSNAGACTLIKMLWDNNAVDGLNQGFQDLGLETLRLKDTNPVNGGHWTNALTMTSLDTAKLLALVNGGPGVLWTTPAGRDVTAAELTPASHKLFLDKLGDQGWNWMLSTANFCGRDYPAAGIPQRVAKRWVGPDGTVTVANEKFGQDVRPCNQAAQVTFAHKPGWVSNAGADAGIVKSVPGAAGRQYVIAVFSNLGDQYPDAGRPETPAGTVPVEYTEKFAKLGAAIDRFEATRK